MRLVDVKAPTVAAVDPRLTMRKRRGDRLPGFTIALGLLITTVGGLQVGATVATTCGQLLMNGDFSNGLTGWTTGVIQGSPELKIYTDSQCLPSQSGNPYFAINVPFGESGYVEQAVTLPGDAMLSVRTWGQLDATTATISVIDQDGVEHVLDQYIASRLIDHYTFPGPTFFCTSNQPDVKMLAVTGFGGQRVKIRFRATSPGYDGTFACFDDVSLTAAIAPTCTPTASPTAQPPASLTATSVPSQTPTPTPTNTSLPTSTNTPPPTPTPTVPPTQPPTSTSTATPSDTPTITPTQPATTTLAPTRTSTPIPTPTTTVTATPSPTATPAAVLVGDCAGHGSVTISDIVVIVNIALGEATASSCPHGIPSGSDVNIALIIQAVNNALTA